MVESYYWIWLQQLFGIGSCRSDEVLSRIKSPDILYNKSSDELFKMHFFTQGEINKIVSTTLDKAKEASDSAKRLGCKIITPDCNNYPKRLLNIFSPPLTLYIQGEIPNIDVNLSIAMVGTRKFTRYGEVTAKIITEDLAKAGVIIVSGLAVGIDAICHKTAIDSSAKTIAVIGSGIDNDYPTENMKLRYEIINGNGAVITELMPGVKPSGFNFPMRNRIISGLCSGVVVIEATEKSGTLITAGHALSQDRDVFAVPGNIFKETCAGANKLIKQGAKPVTCAGDILEEYNLYQNYALNKKAKANKEIYDNEQIEILPNRDIRTVIPKKKSAQPPFLNQAQKLIYDFIKDDEKNADEISLELNIPINIVLSTLTELEIFGAIKSLPGRIFTVQ